MHANHVCYGNRLDGIERVLVCVKGGRLNELKQQAEIGMADLNETNIATASLSKYLPNSMELW